MAKGDQMTLDEFVQQAPLLAQAMREATLREHEKDPKNWPLERDPEDWCKELGAYLLYVDVEEATR